MTRAAIIFAAAPVNLEPVLILIGMFLAFAFGLWFGWRALARR